jgi:hypothetical protein
MPTAMSSQLAQSPNLPRCPILPLLTLNLPPYYQGSRSYAELVQGAPYPTARTLVTRRPKCYDSLQTPSQTGCRRNHVRNSLCCVHTASVRWCATLTLSVYSRNAFFSENPLTQSDVDPRMTSANARARSPLLDKESTQFAMCVRTPTRSTDRRPLRWRIARNSKCSRNT